MWDFVLMNKKKQMMDLISVGCFMLKIKLVSMVKSQVQQFELPTR